MVFTMVVWMVYHGRPIEVVQYNVMYVMGECGPQYYENGKKGLHYNNCRCHVEVGVMCM